MKLRSLRSHLVLLVLAALVPVLIFSTIMITVVVREEEAAVEDGLRDTSRALAMAVDRELAGSIRTLEALAVSEHLDTGNLEAFYRHAGRVLQARPDWTTIALFEPTGEQRLNLRAPFGATLPHARDAVAEAAQTRRPVVSNLFVGQVTGERVVGVSVPVLRNGQVRYVLGASFDPAALSKLLIQHQLPTEGVASIVDRNGLIIARSRDHELVGQEAMPALAAKIRQSPSGTLKAPDRAGVPQYSAYSPSLFSGWTISLGIPAAGIDASLRRDLSVIVGGGLVLLGLGLALALIFGRRIATSIVSLSGSAAALGRGEALPTVRPAPVAEVAELRKAIEDASTLLRRREADLRRANVAKDEYLAMLGHELRNPIAAIRIAAKVIDQAGPDTAEPARARVIIERQSRHLARLLDDLLDVSRVTSGKITLARQPVDLKEVVGRCVESLRQAGRLEHHDVSIGAEPAAVEADPTRLEQIVGNLVENAIKYTPPSGRIRVTVAREGADAVLRVRDEGVGIDPALLPRIFDLFAQGERSLDRKEGGLGLGLTLVRRLTELHGGSVQALSAGRGRGSEFVVRLPIADAAPAAPMAATAPAAPGSRHVLIVEDNRDVREALRVLLELLGHQVAEAATGTDGVAAALRSNADLALIDIGLPGLDGYAVARQLRATQRGKDLFLVALTGYGQPEDRRRALEAGFDAHLVKPVDENALLAILAGPSDAAA